MTYCNHKWWSPLKGMIVKNYKTSKQIIQQTTPICLKCGMSNVYYEYSTKMLKERKPCKHCNGRGYTLPLNKNVTKSKHCKVNIYEFLVG